MPCAAVVPIDDVMLPRVPISCLDTVIGRVPSDECISEDLVYAHLKQKHSALGRVLNYLKKKKVPREVLHTAVGSQP